MYAQEIIGLTLKRAIKVKSANLYTCERARGKRIKEGCGFASSLQFKALQRRIIDGDIDLHLHDENTLECKFVAFCYTKQKRVDVVANRLMSERTIDVRRDKLQSVGVVWEISRPTREPRLSLDANRRQFVHPPPELAVLSLTSF